MNTFDLIDRSSESDTKSAFQFAKSKQCLHVVVVSSLVCNSRYTIQPSISHWCGCVSSRKRLDCARFYWERLCYVENVLCMCRENWHFDQLGSAQNRLKTIFPQTKRRKESVSVCERTASVSGERIEVRCKSKLWGTIILRCQRRRYAPPGIIKALI